MLVGCSARGVPILRRVRLHHARLVSSGNYRGKVGYDPPLPCLLLTDGNPWCTPRVSSARDQTAVASLTHLLTLPVTWRYSDGRWWVGRRNLRARWVVRCSRVPLCHREPQLGALSMYAHEHKSG